MTKKSLLTLSVASLLLSGCAMQDPKVATPLPIEPMPQVCSLAPCLLPSRPPLVLTEDAYRALDETEAALTSCAAQVLDCIKKQEAVSHATQGQASVPVADVSGQNPK